MALGILIGLVIAVLCLLIEIRFQNKATSRLTERLKPLLQPKGFIIEPPSDTQAAIKDIIEENQRLGKDTNLDDL